MWCENKTGSLVNLKNAHYICYNRIIGCIVASFGEYSDSNDYMILERCSEEEAEEKIKKYSRMVSAIKPHE